MSDDNKKQINNSNDDNFPPLVQENDLPPNSSFATNDMSNPSPADDPIADQTPDVGSSSPQDEDLMPPITTSEPKKKFAGGKIIATILGLFVLIGSVAAGVQLVKQNQNISEKAATDCTGLAKEDCSGCIGGGLGCYWKPANDVDPAKCAAKTMPECGNETGAPTVNPNLPWCSPPPVNNKCVVGTKMCQGAPNNQTGYQCTCVDQSPSGTCNRTVWSCGTYNAVACPPAATQPTIPPGKCCGINGCNANNLPSPNSSYYVMHYRSNDANDPVVNDILVAGPVRQASFNQSCGAEQIDCTYNSENTSRRYATSCTATNPPTKSPSPKPSPSPTPRVVACNQACNGTTLICSGSSPTGGLIQCISQSTGGSLCRNVSCPSQPNCVCPTATPSPKPSPSPTPRVVACNQACNGTTIVCQGIGTGQISCVAQPTGGSLCRNISCPNEPSCTCTVPTAVCQNISAYSTSWVLLTQTQLTELKTGDNVNFCVTGVTNSEYFDMARFTINGVVQEITTTRRPGFDDFCQSYTIPNNTTPINTFNVSAMIHHITLGWK